MTKLQKRIRLAVDLLNAANQVEQMSHDEIRVILRRAAAMLIHNSGSLVTPRSDSAVNWPTDLDLERGSRDEQMVHIERGAPTLLRFNWRLLCITFASTFLVLTAIGLIVR